jgi:hypothetical protein
MGVEGGEKKKNESERAGERDDGGKRKKTNGHVLRAPARLKTTLSRFVR